MDGCNIDATTLAQQTGLPCSTISRLRSNTTEFSPNLSSLLPIAEFFNVTLSQLIGEEPISKKTLGGFKLSISKKSPIPVLNAENILEYLSSNNANDAPLINIDIPLSEKSFAYPIQGNAMDPQFPDKTLLIIDPEIEPENLDHVLVIPNGKRIPIFRQILIDGEDKYLRTLNPAFNEFVKTNEETHRIIGVMIQSRRNFKEIPFQPKYSENQDKKIITIR